MDKLNKLMLIETKYKNISKWKYLTQFGKINRKLELLFIYNTNALLGNTLSLSATQKALSGQTVGGKKINEHLEVTNLKDALDSIKFSVEHYREKFSINLLLELYYTLLLRSNMQTHWLNAFDIKNKKRLNNEFRDLAEVSAGISELIDWTHNDTIQTKTNHIILTITLFSKLLKIKPFNTNNEKIALLILNYELLKNGYPLFVLEKKYTSIFDNAIQAVISYDDITQLTDIILNSLIKNMKMYINATVNKVAENA